MKALAVMVLAAAFAACDRGAPTSPSAPGPGASPPFGSPVPPIQAATLQLSGQIVDDSRVAVADARVTVASSYCFTTCCSCGTARATVTTDALGRYEAALELPPAINPVRAFDVSVEKIGFERTTHYVDIARGPATTRDLRVRRLVTIAVGHPALTEIEIDAADGSCGINYEYTCRMLRVQSAAAGNIVVEVVGESGSRATLVTGNPLLTLGRTTRSLSLPASELSTPEFFVLVDWQSVGLTPERVTLATAVQPVP